MKSITTLQKQVLQYHADSFNDTQTCSGEKPKADSTPHFDENEYHMFCYNRKEYEKEQHRRRLAGVTPIIICMGGPYSDAWYPPQN